MRKGFTLIELIIVMAVFGVLAAGLLASLEPGEQVKRAQDNALQFKATEVARSIVRFQVNTGGRSPVCGVSCPVGFRGGTLDVLTQEGNSTRVVEALSNSGELRQSFITAELSYIYLSTIDGTRNAVCYLPGSRSHQRSSNTVFKMISGRLELDSSPYVCKANGGPTDCWNCLGSSDGIPGFVPTATPTNNPPAPVCGGENAQCLVNANCCQGLVCSANKCKINTVCSPNEGFCNTTEDCCAGLTCGVNSKCK